MKGLLSLLVVFGTSFAMADNEKNPKNPTPPPVSEEQALAEAAKNCGQLAYEDRMKITEDYSVPVVDGAAQLVTTAGGAVFRCIFSEEGVLAGLFKWMEANGVEVDYTYEFPGDEDRGR